MIDITHERTLQPDITMPDLAEFMTTREAAKKLGFHVKTIPGMMRDNELDGLRFGRAWLVSRKAVEEYLKKTKGMNKNDPRRKALKK
ncbi:MAG: helix-turn-helix domain-containing protein [Chloroflexota bacterium]|nr:helix-turn-helix domain-containing protein [Chloroflexota bacterium]